MMQNIQESGKRCAAQRRSICTMTGLAVGFRIVWAIAVDGNKMFGNGWLAVMIAFALALPVLFSLILLRRACKLSAAEALKNAIGTWGTKLLALVLFVVLIYDAAAVIRLMNGAAKYVAMPEGNQMVIMGITSVTAILAALIGVSAAANASVLWKGLMLALLGVLIWAQAAHFRSAWLFPILGMGAEGMLKESIPAAGIFCFSAGGWLMMEPQHDLKGNAILKTAMRTALSTAAVVLMFAMLIPGMIDEPPGRSFRIGRLLMNDRSGLSLEMPYVILIYGGMLNMLIFEMNSAAAALNLCFEGLKRGICVIVSGVIGFATAAAGLAEREILQRISMWYYPIIAVPLVLSGICAWIQMKKDRMESEG